MKTNLDNLYKTNVDQEDKGIWLEVKPGVKFLSRRFKNEDEKVRSVGAKLTKPYTRQIANNSLKADKQREILIKTFVGACLLDWQGIVIDKEEVPYTPEKAVELFIHLPVLFDDLFRYASDYNNYLEEGTPEFDKEDLAKP